MNTQPQCLRESSGASLDFQDFFAHGGYFKNSEHLTGCRYSTGHMHSPLTVDRDNGSAIYFISRFYTLSPQHQNV